MARHARPWQVGPGRGEKRLAVCSGAEWVGISGERTAAAAAGAGAWWWIDRWGRGGVAGAGTGTGTGCCVLLPLLVGVSLPRSQLRPPCVPPHYPPHHTICLCGARVNPSRFRAASAVASLGVRTPDWTGTVGKTGSFFLAADFASAAAAASSSSSLLLRRRNCALEGCGLATGLCPLPLLRLVRRIESAGVALQRCGRGSPGCGWGGAGWRSLLCSP